MSIEEVRTSFEKFKEAFEPGLQGSPSSKKKPLGWIEEVLNMLSGDLNHDRVAEVKNMLRARIDSARLSNPDKSIRGCLLSKLGRGDCEHAVGLPGKSIPGRHDGPDDTLDEYDRPNGWCEVCWRGRQIQLLEFALAVKTAKSKAKIGILTKDDIKQLTPRSRDEYTAYVVEAKRLKDARSGCPVYLQNREPDVWMNGKQRNDVWIWTPDIDKAFQFCRRRDARRYAGKSDGTWEIVEHGFYDEN